MFLAWTVAASVATGAGDFASGPADTTRFTPVLSAPRQDQRRFPWRSPFDTVHTGDYSSTHTFSFGHFIEQLPGYFLERSGPIGADAAYSRYGMGRGRGTVYLGGVPLNDPQDDRAPLVLVPTTGIGRLVFGNASSPPWPRFRPRTASC